MSGRSDWIAKTVTISESDPRSWLCLILKNFFIKRKGTSSDFYWCQFLFNRKEKKKIDERKKVEKLVRSTCARVCCKSKSTKILKRRQREMSRSYKQDYTNSFRQNRKSCEKTHEDGTTKKKSRGYWSNITKK